GRLPASTRCGSWKTAARMASPLLPVGARGWTGEGHARASGECGAVVVKELGHRAWGAAGDLLEGVRRVVVLAGEDRPLARDEELCLPRPHYGAGVGAQCVMTR